jgi:ribosomal protein S5
MSVGGFKPIGSGVDGDKAYLVFEQNADVQNCLGAYYGSNAVTNFIRAYTETRKLMREAIANKG